MGEFKIGDRVRVINNSLFGDSVREGDIATVVEADGRILTIDFEGEGAPLRQYCGKHHAETYLEPITPADSWDYDPRKTAGFTVPVFEEEKAAFKVGDRVRATAKRPEGRTGTVVKVDGTSILVSFEDWGDGHAGSGACADGTGWWLSVEDLDLISKPTTPPTTSLTLTIDASELDDEIDRLLERIKKLRKKARKAGIELRAA